tara:strand:- start:53 stop:226 length:174 start_codon:yes stop_codon:yes gene_type:complete
MKEKNKLNRLIIPSDPKGLVTGSVWCDMDTGILNFVDSEKEYLRQQRSYKIKKILKK